MRTISKIIVVAFLVWHMFVVGFYSIPRDAKDVFSQWTRMDILPIITPYMYATSQWQIWNIFAPDPLRRVTFYRIEIQKNDTWHELVTIGPDSYSLLRHAARMKLMGNLLDEFSDNRAPAAGRFLTLLCTEHGVGSDTPIRLAYDYYVLPLLTEPQSTQWWRQWTPTPASNIGFTTTCP